MTNEDLTTWYVDDLEIKEQKWFRIILSRDNNDKPLRSWRRRVRRCFNLTIFGWRRCLKKKNETLNSCQFTSATSKSLRTFSIGHGRAKNLPIWSSESFARVTNIGRDETGMSKGRYQDQWWSGPKSAQQVSASTVPRAKRSRKRVVVNHQK